MIVEQIFDALLNGKKVGIKGKGYIYCEKGFMYGVPKYPEYSDEESLIGHLFCSSEDLEVIEE